MSDTYLAWNGREYPWPPPRGWEQRSDGRYWPVESSTTMAPSGGFSPQYGPASAAVFAHAETLPPPLAQDRVGPRPLRRRSWVSLSVGVVVALLLVQFVRLDVLGFTVSQADFVGFDDEVGEEIVPLDEERELTEQSKRALLDVIDCTNDGGAAMEGTVANPVPGERAYLIAVQFFVNGERLRDGFAEVVVPAGGQVGFTARSASPALDGDVRCSFGDVFRFIPE
ncbi:MAG: hypothetical protein ACN4GZ_12010 [Acidimicrobiales bacterium]